MRDQLWTLPFIVLAAILAGIAVWRLIAEMRMRRTHKRLRIEYRGPGSKYDPYGDGETYQDGSKR